MAYKMCAISFCFREYIYKVKINYQSVSLGIQMSLKLSENKIGMPKKAMC